MKHSPIEFVDLSDHEVAAAARSISLPERIAHLNLALRYAELALSEQQRQAEILEAKSRSEPRMALGLCGSSEPDSPQISG
jgi:hypothetical protein